MKQKMKKTIGNIINNVQYANQIETNWIFLFSNDNYNLNLMSGFFLVFIL